MQKRLLASNLILYGPWIILIYISNPTRHTIFDDFIQNIQQLNMFRTSIVHLQEHSYAVCCDLVATYSIWMRPNRNIQHMNATRSQHTAYECDQVATYSIWMLLKMDYWSAKHIELLNVMNKISKYGVSPWITYILLLASLCLSVRPSICMEQLGFLWTDCHKIWLFFNILIFNSVWSWPAHHIHISRNYTRSHIF